LANDYNRDVFAVPGRVTDKYSQGATTWLKPKKECIDQCRWFSLYSQLGYQAKTNPYRNNCLSHSMTMSKSIRFLFKTGKELMDIIASLWFQFIEFQEYYLIWNCGGDRCQEIIWGDIIKTTDL
jgi:DNA processing protein